MSLENLELARKIYKLHTEWKSAYQLLEALRDRRHILSCLYQSAKMEESPILISMLTRYLADVESEIILQEATVAEIDSCGKETTKEIS